MASHTRTRTPDADGNLLCIHCLQQKPTQAFWTQGMYGDGSSRWSSGCKVCQTAMRQKHADRRTFSKIHKEAPMYAAIEFVKRDPDAVQALIRAFPSVMDGLIRQERTRSIEKREAWFANMKKYRESHSKNRENDGSVFM